MEQEEKMGMMYSAKRSATFSIALTTKKAKAPLS